MVLGKWLTRAIGIVSMVVLARLIEPEAFGLIALATICIGFFEMLQAIGIERYLIIQTKLSDELMNSSWTLQILTRFSVCTLLLISADFIADFFNEPQLALIIHVLAVNNVFAAFNNIGLSHYHRELDFQKLTYLQLISKLLSTLITLTVAYIYPSYWALLAGSMSTLWIYLVGSYVVCDYRPKLNFHFERKMFSFSGVILCRNFLSYCRSKADALLVSRLFDATALGMYKVGADFAQLPLTEVIYPAGQAILPGMAKFKQDRAELYQKMYKYLALIYAFILPCIVGIWFVAEQFCIVILGEKWADTAPIMASLAVTMVSYPMNGIATNLFDCLGKEKYSIFSDVFGLTCIALMVLSLPLETVFSFSVWRGYIGVAVFVFVLLLLKYSINFSLKGAMMALLPSSIASFAMYFAFTTLYYNTSITFWGLVANILFGALSYAMALLLLVIILRQHSVIWQFWYQKGWDMLQRILVKITNSRSLGGI